MTELFGEEFTDDMKYLGVKWMLDPLEFQRIRGFKPDIGSVFVVGGGSYSDDDEYSADPTGDVASVSNADVYDAKRQIRRYGFLTAHSAVIAPLAHSTAVRNQSCVFAALISNGA